MFLWFSYGYDHQSQGSGPSGITSLGDFSPSVSMGHTSSESMGGSAADAARRSRGSRPTRRQRVAYQSAMCRRPDDLYSYYSEMAMAISELTGYFYMG